MVIKLRHNVLTLLLILFSSLVSADETAPHISLPRIDDVAINAQIPGIEKILKQTTLFRKILCCVGSAAAISGSAYLCYKGFFCDNAKDSSSALNHIIKDLIEHEGSLEDVKKAAHLLAERVSALTNKMIILEGEHSNLKERLKGGIRWPACFKSNFFSTAKSLFMFCLHSIASSVIWSQVINTQRYCQSFFKERDLKWYLGMHSQLGSFMSYADIDGNQKERFEEAQLFQELKGIAQLFDEDQSGNVVRLQELSKMVCSASCSMVQQVTRVIAYMNYVSSVMMNPEMIKIEGIAQKKEEALTYAHYLSSHANACVQSIENLVEEKLKHPSQKGNLLDAVNKFINDLRTMVMGFNRVQQEIGSCI